MLFVSTALLPCARMQSLIQEPLYDGVLCHEFQHTYPMHGVEWGLQHHHGATLQHATPGCRRPALTSNLRPCCSIATSDSTVQGRDRQHHYLVQQCGAATKIPSLLALHMLASTPARPHIASDAAFEKQWQGITTHAMLHQQQRGLGHRAGRSGSAASSSTSSGSPMQAIVAPTRQAMQGGRGQPSRLYSNAPSVEAKRTTPLLKEELVAYLKSGCRPRSNWRIGTEHEKLPFNTKDFTRMNYDQIASVLRKLQSRFGWEPIMEGSNIIGVTFEGQSVTLEPGGQFELSGAPVETIHKTCAELNSHLYQVKAISEELGCEFLGLGFDPKWAVDQIPMMPKDRYNLMRAYMPTVGSMGLDMMFRTCTVQVNLDFESEQDMIEKFRIGLALQPIANALFANSPFKEGQPTGYKSLRGFVWTDVDKRRTGGLPFVFEKDMSFEKYVDYAMDVPMYFVYREGRYVNTLGQSWRDFMEAKLPALPGEYPTLSDWANHLTTIFPEVRLKKFLEMRGADAGPWRMLCSLPAFWVGLIYEPQAQTEALALISDWTADEREYLRVEAPRLGLQTPFRGGTLLDVARKAVAIARGGLERRGYDEAGFLRHLEAIVDSGQSQADKLLELYETKWGKSVDPVFKEFQY